MRSKASESRISAWTPEMRSKASELMISTWTPEMRRKKSELMTGVKRPEVGKKIAAAWTPEMREAARLNRLAFWTPERREAAKKIAAARTPEMREVARLNGLAFWTPEMREAARLRGLAFADDPDWRAKVGRAGEANSNYQGKNASVYGSGFSHGMKKRLIAKRGSVCEFCGVTGSGPTERLDVHHKDFAKTDHSEANLEILCCRCHKARHKAQRISLSESSHEDS